MEVSGQLNTPTPLSPSQPVPIGQEDGWPHSQFGCAGEDK